MHHAGAVRRTRPRTPPRATAALAAGLLAGGWAAASSAGAAAGAPVEAPTLAVPAVVVPDAEAALAEPLTRVLRDELERLGRYRSLGTPRLTLRAMMSAVDCVNDAPECLAAVGRTLGVAKLAAGRIDRVGARYVVELVLLDVATASIEQRRSQTVDDPRVLLDEFPRTVRRLLGLPVQETGALAVRASVPGVTVLLDGVVRGVAPLRLPKLPAGAYTLEARRAGFADWRAQLTVAADRTAEVRIEMGRAGAPAPPRVIYVRTPVGLASRVRPPTWAALGAAVGALAFGATFAVLERQTQGDFDGLEAETPDDVAALEALRSRGDRQALLANVGWVVGALAALGGGALLYRDLRGAREAGPPVGGSGAAVRAAILPAPGGGAALLELTF